MAKGLLSIIFNTLGFATWGWAFLDNLENFKGWILFFVGLIFSYYKLKESRATIKGKELDNQLKENKLEEEKKSQKS